MPTTHPPSATRSAQNTPKKKARRAAPRALPAPPPDQRHWVGIDENGLGPRLGPLVVTAVLSRTSEEGARVAGARPKGALRKRLDDSKKLVSFGDSALGEAWARAIARRQGLAADTPDALLHALALDPRETLRAPCPSDHVGQCWGADDAPFAADEALVMKIGADLDRLATQGVDIASVRIGVVCTKRLNEGVLRGLSRFDADLHMMERLILAARAEAGAEIFAACGKVGGFDKYASSFGPLAGHLHTAIVEGRARSEYRILGVGNIAFVRDADESHLLVCMASLVGKWARDLLMRRIVRYHRADVPELPEASGYHDPVTSRFVDATALTRKARGLADECFLRSALGAD